MRCLAVKLLPEHGQLFGFKWFAYPVNDSYNIEFTVHM